jgi:hypothetical protein
LCRYNVAIIDIPNAFIQTRIEDEKDMAAIKLRGVLVDVLVALAPDVYKPYATKGKKGVSQLIVQCQNALYGTMIASLLYYRKFTKRLTNDRYIINPYDPCVANKMIDGKQMTIVYHVDNCKMSHISSKVMDDTIEWLRTEYESIFEDGSGAMTVHRGKVLKYLGMTLDYSVPGQVRISMIDYVDEILSAFDKAVPKLPNKTPPVRNDIKSTTQGAPKGKSKRDTKSSAATTGTSQRDTKSSAAPEDLFQINEDCEELSQDKAMIFHNLVAKTLYATKQARPDTCTAIAFLTTRVRNPDQDDWRKLVHLMKYLRGTRMLPLTLRADGS